MNGYKASGLDGFYMAFFQLIRYSCKKLLTIGSLSLSLSLSLTSARESALS
jgi:hypothetical protein